MLIEGELAAKSTGRLRSFRWTTACFTRSSGYGSVAKIDGNKLPSRSKRRSVATRRRQEQSASHAAAGKDLLAARAQLGPVLLQALLNRSIIAQLRPAKALRIPCAGLLFLWRTLLTLRKRQRSLRQQNDQNQDD
ncbi:hypothetical protein JQ629_03120 [Bradyrhizobium sp. AUGA SZCCT0222]|nr:hypothetical protein [Bradyrhizobium sp. AUGA SZCCT0222]